MKLQTYWLPIREAILIFPLIAAAITIPYGVIQYRKYERIPIQKILVFYSFVFYLICAYALVILPLPDSASVPSGRETVLLHPLETLRGSISLRSLSLTDGDSIRKLLRSSEFFLLVSNVLLLLPFGVYLRYYSSCRWYAALFYSFLLSLFFELTQLTGLYFLYSEAYRCFEVDDLICNSIGGLIGFWLEPVFEWIFPAAEEVNRRASLRSCRVSILRQLFATFLDWIMVGLCLLAALYLLPVPALSPFQYVCIFLAGAFLFETVCMCISRGYTPGKRICRLKIVRKDHRRCPVWRLALRNVVLYLFLYSAPFLGAYLLLGTSESRILTCLAIAACVLIPCIFSIELIGRCLGSPRPFLYESVTRTYCASVRRRESPLLPERTVFLS